MPFLRRSVLAATAALLLLIPASPASAFEVRSASVGPKKAFFDAREPATVFFRFEHPEPFDVEVRIATRGRVVRSLRLKQLDPAEDHVVEWDGLTAARKPARDGKYVALIGPPGGPFGRAGSFAFRGHRYPVAGPHGFRGAVGKFRAARNGGRWHHGFDVVARCGTPLIAVRGGKVIAERFDGRLDGHYLIVRGRKENLTYRYSHLPRESRLNVGDRVRTGDVVGRVGKSGNAASVGCHLHFEVKRRGRFIDPEPLLRAWDRWS